MTKARKVDLLYSKAKGRGMDATAAELKELRKYKVDTNESGFVVTRANVSAYVTAVDKGSSLNFYDWCLNHGKADRRRKGSSAKEIASDNRWDGFGAVFLGVFPWALCLYWWSNESLGVGASLVLGAIISLVLCFIKRKDGGITLFILPLALLVLKWVFR